MNSPYADNYGGVWKQPNKWDILVNDKEAVMPQYVLERLSAYNSTIPSGVYTGKMWRRLEENTWYLCWFSEEFMSGGRPSCYVMSRPIRIFDWKAYMGVV